MSIRFTSPRVEVHLLALGMLMGCSISSVHQSSGQGLSSGQIQGYPGELVHVEDSKLDFFVRQHIAGTYEGRAFSFDVALQKVGEQLIVVGLTPMGTKAFLLKQTGPKLQFEQFFPGKMPFDAEYILRDIHRSIFWHLWPIWPTQNSSSNGPSLDGERSAIWAGEQVVEQWSKGRLLERRFKRVDGNPQGEIRIRYHGQVSDNALPPKIELDNGWFGYRLMISNIDYQPL